MRPQPLKAFAAWRYDRAKALLHQTPRYHPAYRRRLARQFYWARRAA